MKENERHLHNNHDEKENTREYCTSFCNDMTDDELDEYIEKARCEYYNEWWKYIEEDAE